MLGPRGDGETGTCTAHPSGLEKAIGGCFPEETMTSTTLEECVLGA